MNVILAFLFVLIANPLLAQAIATLGGEAGGGGKAVVCRNPAGAISTVQLLDLWEASAIYSEPLAPVSGNLAEAVDANLLRLQGAYPYTGYSSTIGGRVLKDQDLLLALLR